MKKILLSILDLFLLLVLVCFISGTVKVSNLNVEKNLNIEQSRIINAETLSDNEKILLDDCLKQNNNVLLLYYETNAVFDKNTEQLILRSYTTEEIPYVIFVYNPNEQSLMTVSSSKEILEFDDISLKNVNSYTEVYRHIYGIKSKVISPFLVENTETLVMIVVIILAILIYIVLASTLLIEELLKWLKWNEHYEGFEYKVSFFGRYYKIKNTPSNVDIIKILANVPLKTGNEYFVIDRHSCDRNLNTFCIKNSYLSKEIIIEKDGHISSFWKNYMYSTSYEKSYKYTIYSKDIK